MAGVLLDEHLNLARQKIDFFGQLFFRLSRLYSSGRRGLIRVMKNHPRVDFFPNG